MNSDLSVPVPSDDTCQVESQVEQPNIVIEMGDLPLPLRSFNPSGQQSVFGSLLHTVSEIHVTPVSTKSNDGKGKSITQEQIDRIAEDHPYVKGKEYKKPQGRPPSSDLLNTYIYRRKIDLYNMYMDEQQPQTQSIKRTREERTNLPSEGNDTMSDQSPESSPEVNLAKAMKLTSGNKTSDDINTLEIPDTVTKLLAEIQEENAKLWKENEKLWKENESKESRLNELEKLVENLKSKVEVVERNTQRNEPSELESTVAELNGKLDVIESRNKEVNGCEEGPRIKDWASVVKDLESGSKQVEHASLLTKASEIIDTSKHIEDMNKRKNRVIIFGMEASKSQDQKTIDKHEWNMIDSVFSHIGMDNKQVEYCFRLRTRTTDTSRPAPLVLALKPGFNRNSILAVARKLKSVQGYENVYIKPDLTFIERQREKELRQVRDEYNTHEQKSNLPYQWRIRRNNVYRMTLNDRPQKPSSVQSDRQHEQSNQSETMQH